MLQFSFKNRIAFNYLLSTALMVLFVFFIIFNIVQYTVYSHVDNNLSIEVNDHLSEITIANDSVRLIDTREWNEIEHNTLSVNPVFVEALDRDAKPLVKSPNLRRHHLMLAAQQHAFRPFDTELAGKLIRQVQFPVLNKGKKAGYILIAMSLEEPQLVLQNLSRVLWISYPVILLLLFFTARFIAGKNIRPIKHITATANTITRDNLNARIALPQHKDELYVLSKTINDLLERIGQMIVREKEFTSNASHELRTPLAVVKGTLEVLVRKPREKSEYEAKIKYCISEVDRLNNLVDQLLLLARFENDKIAISKQSIELDEIILQSLERFSAEIDRSKITIDFSFSEHFQIVSDPYLVSIIIENLLSNALKYSHRGGNVHIGLARSGSKVVCTITDNGIGIRNEDLGKIYEQFYRSQAVGHPAIKGTGLGLSIVRRLCELLQIDIKIDSAENAGTTVAITFTH